MQNHFKKLCIDEKWIRPLAMGYFVLRFALPLEAAVGVFLFPGWLAFYGTCLVAPGVVFLIRPCPVWLTRPVRKAWLLGVAGGLMALALYLCVDALNFNTQVHVSGRRIIHFFELLPSKLVMAVGEEIFFRGFLQESLRARGWGLFPTICVSAFLFFLAHGYHPPVYWAATFPYGLILGWVAFRTRSIWPSALGHAMGNASVAFVTRLG